MRGGRNKFGPMYKRDRARKLQIMRQRQLALQALRGSIGGGVGIGQIGSDGTSSQLQGMDYHQPYSNMHIKQEIQIPQVSIIKLNIKVAKFEAYLGSYLYKLVIRITEFCRSISYLISLKMYDFKGLYVRRNRLNIQEAYFF